MNVRIVASLVLSLAAPMVACDDAGDERPQTTTSSSVKTEVTPRPVKPPKQGTVLRIEPNVVVPNLRVEVTFAPPPKQIWGADAELLKIEGGKLERIAYLSTWAGKNKISTVWPQPNLGFPDIGFYGKETWQWRIPARLQPGTYAIEKEAIENGNEPIEERINEWRVRFKVR